MVIISISLDGSIFFHSIFISVSYRSRGSAPRAQIKISDIIDAFRISSLLYIFLIDIMTVSNLINKIFMYSAIKIRANNDLLYSILNPETSSDSPSVKSNGARCVSAKIEMIHDKSNGSKIIVSHEY